MARNIKLNSSDWCDIVFTGKNKAYGAYALRQSSSKRHILAFCLVVVFVGGIAGLPSILNAINPPKEYVDRVTVVGPNILSDLDDPIDEPILEEPSTPPPPPPLINTQGFTPPVVTPDELVNEERELLSQAEMNESTAQISVETVVTDNTTGVDIADILREERQITNQRPQEPTVHEVVEVIPQFPGGNSELMRYLGTNMKYPTIAAENGIEGRAVLKFVVSKDGSISNIQVLRSLDPSCDKEAIRVVKSMPKWIPGQQNGHPVAVYFTLPVLFKLQR